MRKGNPAATALVQRLYTHSLSELLEAYGLADRIVLRAGEPAGHRSSCVSITSLTGAGVRVVSTLDIDLELLASIYPAREHPATGADLEDWSREFNNQLLGRVKNKLLEEGCSTILGLPSLLVGTDISAVVRDDLDTMQLHYVSDAGRMVATLVTMISAMALRGESGTPAEQGILREGAVSLF